MKSNLRQRVGRNHKHKIIVQALAKSGNKRRNYEKFLSFLALRVSEDLSCFVFALILSLSYVARVNQAFSLTLNPLPMSIGANVRKVCSAWKWRKSFTKEFPDHVIRLIVFNQRVTFAWQSPKIIVSLEKSWHWGWKYSYCVENEVMERWHYIARRSNVKMYG